MIHRPAAGPGPQPGGRPSSRTRSNAVEGGGAAEVSGGLVRVRNLREVPAGRVEAGGLHGRAERAIGGRGRGRPRQGAATDRGDQAAPRRAPAPSPAPAPTPAPLDAEEELQDAESVDSEEPPLTPTQAARRGDLGHLISTEMEKLLEAIEGEELGDSLAHEGLLDTVRLLEVGGGGLKSPLQGLAYNDAKKKLVRHVRRGGCTLGQATLERTLDRIVRACKNREEQSLRLREGAVGLAAAVGEQAPGGRAIPHQGLATEKQSGYEKDRTLVDTLLGNVALQLRGKPLPAVLTPVLADVIVAVDALTRNPGRMPRFESLSMASRTSDEKGGDLKRYRADKTFEHRRGRSAEHEYNLIDDYLVIISIAGAQVAPKQMKVDTCDEQSGVRLLEDKREDDEDTVLIAQYPALRSISAQIRRVGQKAKLDGHGARLFVDAILADATNCLVQGCTVTASLENALRGHYEMQASNGRRSSSHKRSRRSRSRSSASGSESDGEATSSGSEASSRKVVSQACMSQALN